MFGIAGKQYGWRSLRAEHLCGTLLVIGGSVLIGVLAWNREYFSFGTETDYISGFIQEAQRIRSGQPLAMAFHPPFYPFVLALVQGTVYDWFVTGVIISWFASLVVLIATYRLFSSLGGAYLGCGALIGLLTSPVYLSYSAFATSDLFFLSLYTACLLSVMVADQTQRYSLWATSGVLFGLTVLTRTNGIVVLLLLAVPWFQRIAGPERVKQFACVLISFAATLLIWVVLAAQSGSPVWPTQAHANLALTYFADGFNRVSGEGRVAMEEQFDGIRQVLAHDPLRLATTYVLDAARLVRRIVTSGQLAAWPLNILALPGLILLLLARRHRFVAFLAVITVVQVLLVNFKSFEARFYLFLLPMFGAGTAFFLKQALDYFGFRMTNNAAIASVAVVVLLACVSSTRTANMHLHASDAELSDVVPVAKKLIAPNSVVLARKPHLAYYTDSQNNGFPNVGSLTELRAEIMSQVRQPAYLYYGRYEGSRRSQFEQLGSPEATPEWLRPVAQSETPGRWVLYRIEPDGGPTRGVDQ